MKKILLSFLLLSFCQLYGQWFNQNINTNSFLSGLQFLNGDTGWLYAGNPSSNSFYKSTDGGYTWEFIIDIYAPLTSHYFLNSGEGWINYFGLPWGTNLIKTTDGGITFSQPIYYENKYFYDMIFFDSQNGIAAGGYWNSPQWGVIYNTSDGGLNWSIKLQNPGPFLSLSFIDNVTGWCATGDSIFKTIDGGMGWHIYPINGLIGNISKIQFNNDSSGWVKSQLSLYSTTDGGTNWNLKANPVTDFWFSSQTTGWYTYSDKIYYTTDAGENWEVQFSSNGKMIRDIYFIDSVLGWACGDDGLIVHTINAGTPVELISFTAENIKNSIYIRWITSTETNNKGFFIERKSTNSPWKEIAFIEGKGTITEQQSYSYIDRDLPAGVLQYRLKQFDFDGTYNYSYVLDVKVITPIDFSLHQNYPNPFNPVTTFSYSIPENGRVSLILYDPLGRELARLVDEEKSAGLYTAEFSAEKLPSGFYLCQLKFKGFVQTKKMILLK